MASKRNVRYIEPEVPSFVKKFKERVGYKEQANVNDKFSEEIDNSESKSGENEREIEEEKPVVVVLKQGDLTADEVEKIYEKENSNTDCWDSKKDKPIFKKPEKRPSSNKEIKKDRKQKKTDVKAVKNSKLLSFDDDEEN